MTPLLADFRDAAGCYARVADALAARSPGFRLMAVATTGTDGPEVRTVVVRGFDPAARTVTFHADLRSPKIPQLAADPRVGVVLYDSASRVQLRIRARAEVHHGDEVARAAWDATRPSARGDYASAAPPSAPLSPDAPNVPEPLDPGAFTNFAVVVCQVVDLDVLELRDDGHCRGRFRWTGDEIRLERLQA